MDKPAPQKRIFALRNQIEQYANEYYILDAPTVSDGVYDSLVLELKDLEKQYPDLADPNFIIYRVGGRPLEKFVKVQHASRMLSLSDVFSFEELEAWEKRISKLIPEHDRGEFPIEYFCELKLDGLAVSLIYEKGKFVRGATRGDGLVGEDITQNLKTISSIPLSLSGQFSDCNTEIRGEAVMSKKVLEKLNDIQRSRGKALFANTRNSAAGSLRQLDPKLAASRRLDFFAYDIVSLERAGKSFLPQTHSEEHSLLRTLGFQVEAHEKVCKNMKDVKKFVAQISKKRDGFFYGTDGVVISLNNQEFYEQVGVVGKAPRYMVAYKYPAEQATTVIIDIKVSVGRTGVLTPVAYFNPTLVAGSTVAKSTLHNADQIGRLDVRTGDTVVIQKAGDVIPEVVEVLKSFRTGKEKKFSMPSKCPVCGGRVERRGSVPPLARGRLGGVKSAGKNSTPSSSPLDNGENHASVAYYCTNAKCPAKNSRQMQHFVNILEIYEIGPKILDRFQDESLISDAADIFTLKKGDIQTLERFGEQSAENIIVSINNHKRIILSRFIYALGILHVGEQTAEDLASHFGSLEKLKNASIDEINAIENIGPVVSRSVHEYFHTKENLAFVGKLLKNGVVIVTQKSKIINQKLSGKTFVITGTLDSMSRGEAKKRIKALGGKVAESVSKNTDYVIVGAGPGSKAEKAKKLGVKLLEEEEFLKIF